MMAQFKVHAQLFKLAFAISSAGALWAISLTLLGLLPVRAQSERRLRVSNEPLIVNAPPPSSDIGKPETPIAGGSRIFNAPPPPPDIGKPQTTTGGGSRGECESEAEEKPTTPPEKQGLTALVPSSGWGLTTSVRPTFWFYVAYSRQLPGEFVLQDEATQQTIYQAPLMVTGTPGVVSVSLPSTVAPLEIGKQYRWGIELFCNPQKTIFVEGLVQRVELNPALESQLAKATPQQRVALYAKEGFWYDALMIASELHRTNSQNANWATLLNDVGLDAIATKPIVECCAIQNSKFEIQN